MGGERGEDVRGAGVEEGGHLTLAEGGIGRGEPVWTVRGMKNPSDGEGLGIDLPHREGGKQVKKTREGRLPTWPAGLNITTVMWIQIPLPTGLPLGTVAGVLGRGRERRVLPASGLGTRTCTALTTTLPPVKTFLVLTK